MKVLAAQLYLTLRPHGQRSLAGYSGVSCHALLQGIFQTQGWNPSPLHLPHWQADSLPSEAQHYLLRDGVKEKKSPVPRTYLLKPSPQCYSIKSPCGCAHAQLCLILYNRVDCSQSASSVHGILQGGILEWVVLPSSRESA